MPKQGNKYTDMSKASSQQLASKLPKASSVACIGFSVTTLYAFYNMNARKERLKGQIQPTNQGRFQSYQGGKFGAFQAGQG
jgi:hypothetical protein